MNLTKIAILSCCGMIAASVAAVNSVFIPADDSRLQYTDYANMKFIPSPADTKGKAARFSRPLNNRKGYGFDNPGTRLRFRTSAPNVSVSLYYNELHQSTTARNPEGIYQIDGKTNPKWNFRTKARKAKREMERVDVKLATPGDGKAHDYDIIMPYGDSVDVLGISVPAGSTIESATPRPSFTCIIYGDSITHGFTAKNIGGTYAFKTAQLKGWQFIDMGIGGRASTASDGKVLGEMKADYLTVLMGVNDWQGGRPLPAYEKNIMNFIKNFRKLKPDTPVCFITPLWVPPTWKPKKAKYDLEEYRKVLRKIVSELKDPKIKLVEGPELIDHYPANFDRVAVHPNDKGFSIMSERLAKQLP